ncbi:tyrosine-type recombinase/integrase [Stenoxybacter acetivorans]|uniref:tyrosine-type recombinase/integrase n=1 Tax=Stenoxybacter acetivorans TaxID=422441 RepID=UPI0005667764|nr:integrase arm-type DNA-binding domain-containing protein [Stenoxybacter acetivorans]
MKLKDLIIKSEIKQAKQSGGQIKKLFDGNGLFLLISPVGGASWKYAYRFNGKSKTLTLGKYPLIPLIQARQKHFEARQMLANGIDPAAAKQEAKVQIKQAACNTFEHIAREWHEVELPRWQASHAEKVLKSLEEDTFPYIGDMPITKITPEIIIETVKRVQERGAYDTASRVFQRIDRVLEYAVVIKKLISSNAAYGVRRYIATPATVHLPAIPQKDLPEFFRRLHHEPTRPETKIALLLLILTFTRVGSLRAAEWAEFDFPAQEWRIPKDKMKGRRVEHIVPLSDWALELLTELQTISGKGRYLFPGRNSTNQPMSANALLNLMHKLGYKDIATPHGFRSLATDVLNEHDFNSIWIERQMAHLNKDKVQDAYLHSDFLPHRRRMMQWYSDWIRERYQQGLEG